MIATVYVVNVDNYFPDLCKITLPNIEQYARKINANFQIIDQRKFPDFPPTYEKVQVYELSQINKDDWSILIDADMMISPMFENVLKIVPQDNIGLNLRYVASDFFEKDDYFERDGRDVGVVTQFVVANKICRDIWTPLEFTATEALKKTKREFIVDEYCMSRNLAKFGLKFSCIHTSNCTQYLIRHLDVTTKQRECVIQEAQKIQKEFEQHQKLLNGIQEHLM